MLSKAQMESIASLRNVREFKRPLPVDHDFRDLKPIQGPRGVLHVPFGVQAHGALGVYSPWRDDMELRGYARSPWALLRTQVRDMAMEAFIQRHTVSESNDFSLTDTGGASRTLRVGTTGVASSFNENMATAGTQITERWGSSATAPTGADSALTAQVDSVSASSMSYDTVGHDVTHSGSKVYSGANTTAREIGFSQAWQDIGAVLRDILFDHSTISDTAVNDTQTVAVSYVVSF